MAACRRAHGSASSLQKASRSSSRHGDRPGTNSSAPRTQGGPGRYPPISSSAGCDSRPPRLSRRVPAQRVAAMPLRSNPCRRVIGSNGQRRCPRRRRPWRPPVAEQLPGRSRRESASPRWRAASDDGARRRRCLRPGRNHSIAGTTSTDSALEQQAGQGLVLQSRGRPPRRRASGARRYGLVSRRRRRPSTRRGTNRRRQRPCPPTDRPTGQAVRVLTIATDSSGRCGHPSFCRGSSSVPPGPGPRLVQG